jgi:hypothetical protein
MDLERFPRLVASIYALVDELEAMFPGRHFTPDGHMVGSLGEALAAYYYGITLHPASAHRHDGICNGVNVQVKATQANSVAITSEPDHLLVLGLNRDGTFREVFNGPGKLAWALVAQRVVPEKRQYKIPISTLLALMNDVPVAQRLRRVHT